MKKDTREEWYDAVNKVALTEVEVSSAAAALASGHLLDDIPAGYLAEGLVFAALLGAEMSEPNETVIVQMKCTGALGGYVVECTQAGTLRGYTEKKTNVERGLGSCRYQITRSVPGRIISQGIATSIDEYFADSLQRRVKVMIDGSKGTMIEALPDSRVSEFSRIERSAMTLKKSTPLKFACRCSPDRAIAMLKGLSAQEQQELPETLDITCHLCGRTFTIKPNGTTIP